ncbi:XRE family transcriptional regulator [Providencia rettgeri]|uniref:helix-turn-helix domain-containing protein n=1 Tax=Providencia TaxID=586 RepID=UPI001C835770|nr:MULTISPECIES: helix-turn-helix domain-containing protein [Providencia]MBX6968825.1 XRE family transcriptional regulator [Providencia rettgeri]MBX6977491.1 XRE family transcriptional regulator [Providencia rettgeri]MBX6994559.1 XRE family transcriptional regulator [Providencia rettgeri]MBX6997318.1 XRE family transcriptional regulator [Providencia rettgeri]MBX7017432.1 XRE family transcriptional regulator [Providencia rettgeri]
MTNHDTLASRLTRRRAELGYTQDELAKLAEIAPAQLSRYEAGVNKPRAKMIAKLAYALAVPYEWLETGDETNFSIDAPKEKGEIDLYLLFPEEISNFLLEEAAKSGEPVEQTLEKIVFEFYKARKEEEEKK